MKVIENGRTADPLLKPLAMVDGALIHPLMPGSPAVDAGVTRGAPETDQRGVLRDSRVDVGAFEQGLALSASLKEPVAYLAMNEGKGKLARDISTAGRSNSGVLKGGASWAQGIEGGAIAFDGENDAVKLKNSSDINLGRHDERTVSLWFKSRQH